ncbi:DUF1868 domain-containing protein [Legionella sp. D16C41]|uniref:DUF1868 domain-containing protein n=1 Tax=Legionella sp. D16C41 TaxID=3402688 RepID=UPI003AF82997
MELKKIDQQGNYCDYPGITVIAKVDKREAQFWSDLYHLVTQIELEQKCYTPLPWESYHMTAIRVINKAQYGQSDWREFLTRQKLYFQELANYLNENSFLPEITFEKLNITDTVYLSVNLPNNQSELINKIAEQFNLSFKIYKPFHITLAYFYKNPTFELKSILQEQITERLEKLYKLYGKKFTLESPKLCFYTDMTNFINWDGENYPFNK